MRLRASKGQTDFLTSFELYPFSREQGNLTEIVKITN